jgi:CheY-like chemotaxis protein
LLRGLDYRVLEARDGASALSVLAGSPRVDALLADVMLPGGMTGPKVAEEALRRNPDLKVLLMSGYTEKAVRNHGHLSGAAELLQKPFRRYDLARKLRTVLDGT